MKTNLKSKRNIPAVAYLCQNECALSVFIEGQLQLIRQKITEKFDFELALKTKPLAIRQGTKLSIILSNHLVLYSQLKLPLNLSDREVAELIDLQLSQRQQDSLFVTYYDYYLLQKFEDSVIFGLFEARKDKLDSVIQSLKHLGFIVSLMIPQTLVVINQILNNNDLSDKKYQIICRLDQQVLIAQIADHELVEIRQIHINKNQSDISVYPELQMLLNQSNGKTVICLGINVVQFKDHLIDSTFELINYESLSAQADMTAITIKWMAEQYDLYKSIALA